MPIPIPTPPSNIGDFKYALRREAAGGEEDLRPDPAVDIAPLLSSVLFGNEKARQIVRAAHDVLSKFGGVVPETANITNPPRLMYALSPNPLDGRMRILASP